MEKKIKSTVRFFAFLMLAVMLAAAVTVASLADDQVEVDNETDLQTAINDAPASGTNKYLII